MPKKKLLWISDSPAHLQVGQSVVARKMLNILRKDYDVEALGFGHNAATHPVQVPYNVMDCNRQDMHYLDGTGKNDKGETVRIGMKQFIEKSKPDVVICSHDPWIYPAINQVRATFPDTKFIGYLTIDGEPAYYGWYNFIKPYDKVISPTEYGKRVLLDRWMDLNVGVVPYGIDHSIYHLPRQGKEQLKTQITLATKNTPLEGYINLHNKFVAIYVGANQDRKNLGLIHESWREFEKSKETNVTLLMFTHSSDLKVEAGHYDLFTFSSDTKTLKIINQIQPEDIIGQYMAASDILLHPSAGEGFGLSIVEAMSCGTVPVVLPFAGVTDFCTQHNSYGVPFIEHVGGYHVHRAVSSVGNVVEVLNQAYNNPQERMAKAQNAMTDSAKFTWENSAQLMSKHIDEVLGMDKSTVYVKQVL